jgi:hypothetical protein
MALPRWVVGCGLCSSAMGMAGERAWVVLVFMRAWSKWPWCMAMDCGGYFLTAAEVRPGQVVNCPALMAAHHVDREGG